MCVVDFSEWRLLELKELLEELGLLTKGKKAELVLRLQQAEEAGVSMENLVRNIAEETQGEASVDSRLPRQGSSREGSSTANGAIDSAATIELLRRQNEVAERELDLMRRELNLMREMQRLSLAHPAQGVVRESSAEEKSRRRVKEIAGMLGSFDGNSDAYERWEKQLRWIKEEYNLEERDAKALVCQNLTGSAAEWFYSKSDYLQMRLEDLIQEIKRMFYNEQEKADRRRRFEERMWRKDESFKEYFHEKIILANRVPIEEEEMVENLIRGIPDSDLRDLARAQQFASKASFLRAFQFIQWRGKRNVPETAKREVGKPRSSAEGNRETSSRDTAIKRCRNCGKRFHLWTECPTKDLGKKCFECCGHGHVASECPKKTTTALVKTTAATKDTYVVSESNGGKYFKEVEVNGQKLNALIGTGSDLSLISVSKYIELGAPRMKNNIIQFRGIGTDNNRTLGDFEAKIVVDESIDSILIRVISDNLMRHDLLIGADFLRKMEIQIVGSTIRMMKIDQASKLSNVPEIFSINVCETDAIDLSYIENVKHRKEVEGMIMSYSPIKTRDVNVKISIVLKDEEPIYQRASRLSPSEEEQVREQVDTWLREGIIRPSLSKFASPVVLVKKKDGSHRLCVDYRLINNNVIFRKTTCIV